MSHDLKHDRFHPKTGHSAGLLKRELTSRIGLPKGWNPEGAKPRIPPTGSARDSLASILVIGPIGFFTERLVFGSLEHATIYRWGMAKG